MSVAYQLLIVMDKVNASIDKNADLALIEIAHHVTQCRRAMGQHFRKLKRDLQNDQNTQ